MKIKTRLDRVDIKTLIVMLYGQPGSGKTTLAFTCKCLANGKKVLVLDFDNGYYRAHNYDNYVPIESWEDIARITANDIKDFDTIVIDTVGRALDFLTQHIIKHDSQMAMRSGALTLQGYGALKATFTGWLRQLRTLGKDIILISHDKEEKEKDLKYVRPDIAGGSYSEIIKIADFVGYTYFINDKRFLDFNPCEKFIGKNSAGLELIGIPSYIDEPEFMYDLIVKMKESINSINEEQKQVLYELQPYFQDIELMNTLKEFNNFYFELKKKTLDKGIKTQIWTKLTDKGKQLNFSFDKKDDLFINL